MMLRVCRVFLVSLIVLLLASCSSSQEEIDATITIIAADVFTTQKAAPAPSVDPPGQTADIAFDAER